MLLAVDVGNTDIKLGVFDGERLCGSWRWASERARMADEYAAQLGWALEHSELSLRHIERTILCSVVPQLTHTFEQLVHRYLDATPLLVRSGMAASIRLEVD